MGESGKCECDCNTHERTPRYEYMAAVAFPDGRIHHSLLLET